VERLPIGLSIKARTLYKTVDNEQLALQALTRLLVTEHTPRIKFSENDSKKKLYILVICVSPYSHNKDLL